MLQLLFQGLEQFFGPTLSSLASVIYWSGVVLLTAAVLLPFYRRWMEYLAREVGLAQQWVMTCATCGKQTVVTGRNCGYCDEQLDIPGRLRLWTGATRKPREGKAQHMRWMIHLVGNTAFLACSLGVVAAVGATSLEGTLHRLFVGVALPMWAAVGWLAGRALRLDQGRALARLRDGAVAVTAMGATIVLLALADQARGFPETVLARFSAESSVARIDGKRLPLSLGSIGFEYLKVDHELLGIHQVIGLAFVGQERLTISRCPLKTPIINHLRDNPDAYAARGLTVRLRTDRHQVTPGENYEVVKRRDQVLIRRARQIRPAD